jgi:hypothetical protein
MSQAVTIQHEVSTVKAMINEIQTDICKSHEGMARLWLASVPGLQWIEGLAEQRSVHICMPVLYHTIVY